MSNNYSPLNSYKYDQKPRFMAVLDTLSSPARSVLGGKNIYVHTQTYDHPKSIVKRVFTVFFAVLIAPVAVVSIASLLIKLAITPSKWEEKKVAEQSAKTWELVGKIQNGAKAGNLAAVEQGLGERPALMVREEIQTAARTILQSKIDQNAPWSEFSSLIAKMPENTKQNWIEYAVKARVQYEAKNDLAWLSPEQIINLVENTLQNPSSRIACYQTLIQGALQIDPKDDVLLNIYKIDMIYFLIAKIGQLKLNRAATPLDKASVQLEMMQMPASAVKGGSMLDPFVILLKQDDECKALHEALTRLRAANALADRIPSLASRLEHCKTVQDWKVCLAGLEEVRADALKLVPQNSPFDAGMQALLANLEKTMKFMNAMWSSEDKSQLKKMQNELAQLFGPFGSHLDEMKAHFQVKQSFAFAEVMKTTAEMKFKLTMLALVKNLRETLIEKGVAAAVAFRAKAAI